MNTELLVIEKFNLELVPFFTKGDRLNELLEAIKIEVMAHVPDVSNIKGRNAIKANITAGKKYRTHLEECGKKLSAEYKLMPKTIDTYRGEVKVFLLDVEAEARKELTAWELIDKAEKAQVADTDAYLIKFDADLEEGYRDNELIDLKAKQAKLERQAEIDKAADAAKVKAKEDAAEEIKQANIDKEKAEADARFAVAAAADAKWLAYISEAYSHNDQLTAAKSARDAVLRSQREEDDRIKTEKKAREADKNHKHTVKVEAMEDFIAAGLSEDSARIAVRSLCFKNIRHCGINF